LIEILLIRLSLRVNRISIKGQWRRGICKADKGGAGAVGLVSIEPGVGIRCFGAHNSSSGICRRPAGRTRGDHTKDSSGPRERRHPIHRRERRGPRRAASKAGRRKIQEMKRRLIQANGFDEGASGSDIKSVRSVGLKTLKNKLREYVRLAAGGETVLVTDRDRVVAEIGPPHPLEARGCRTSYCWTPSGRVG
jgi:hypothetical protein